MRRILKFSLILGCLFSACGVKKYPDLYYQHPINFNDVSPSPTPELGVSPAS